MKTKLIILAAVTIFAGSATYGLDAPYRKQVKEFTAKCHEEKGVVVEEHDTRNLLCFPANA